MMIIKIPDRFIQYFACVTLVLLLGIGIVVLQSAVPHPAPDPLNATELNERYVFHATVVVPRMTHVYPQLLLSNAGVALFILIVPLYWAWIW